MNVIVKNQEEQGLQFEDLKDGDIFGCKMTDSSWDADVYIMLNKKRKAAGQCVCLSDGKTTWFDNSNGVFRLFDTIELSNPIYSR